MQRLPGVRNSVSFTMRTDIIRWWAEINSEVIVRKNGMTVLSLYSESLLAKFLMAYAKTDSFTDIDIEYVCNVKELMWQQNEELQKQRTKEYIVLGGLTVVDDRRTITDRILLIEEQIEDIMVAIHQVDLILLMIESMCDNDTMEVGLS